MLQPGITGLEQEGPHQLKGFGVAAAGTRAAEGGADPRPVGGIGLGVGSVDVGPVDVQAQQVLDHPAAQPVGRAGQLLPGPVAADRAEHAHQPVDVGPERPVHHLELGVPGDLLEVVGVPGGLGPALAERHPAGRVDEQAAGEGAELVAGGAVDRPGVGQRLVAGEDLLDPEPAIGVPPAHPLQVGPGLAQAVDVVDPDRVDVATIQQRVDQHVGGVQHLGVLDPDPDQRRDVEEVAVVHHGGRLVPVGQRVVLIVQQAAQGVGVAVPALESLGQANGLGLAVRREPLRHLVAGGHPLLGELRVVDPLGEAGQPRAREHGGKGLPRERQPALAVGHHHPGVHDQPDQPLLQGLVEGPVQERCHDPSTDQRMVPVDVEVAGEGAAPARHQHVPPPAVAPVGDRHVVGDDVEEDAEAPVAGGVDQGAEAALAPQVVGDAGGVDHVVPVRRTLGGLEDGRAVEVADPEAGQVVEAGGELLEAEARTELDPVGRSHRRGATSRSTTTDRAATVRRATAAQHPGARLLVGRGGVEDDLPRPRRKPPVAVLVGGVQEHGQGVVGDPLAARGAVGDEAAVEHHGQGLTFVAGPRVVGSSPARWSAASGRPCARGPPPPR